MALFVAHDIHISRLAQKLGADFCIRVEQLNYMFTRATLLKGINDNNLTVLLKGSTQAKVEVLLNLEFVDVDADFEPTTEDTIILVSEGELDYEFHRITLL